MMIDWVELAERDDPSGKVCGWCGGINTFADDCGWFATYINPETKERLKEGKVCCEDCWKGIPGAAHIEIYGLGER